MFRGVLSRYLIIVALMALVLTSSVYAGEAVEVTDHESSTGEIFVVGVVDLDAVTHHDRVDSTMQEVPEEYCGLTSIMTSMDTGGDANVQWMFEIDRSAYVYIAFDDRWDPPEDREQDPEDWFNDAFTKTGEVIVVLDVPDTLHYWIYKSNEPYPEGEVTLHGISKGGGDAWYRITFLQEAKGAAVAPQEKLAARWGEIKSLK